MKTFDASIDPKELLDFHMELWQEKKTDGAMTCYPTVYQALVVCRSASEERSIWWDYGCRPSEREKERDAIWRWLRGRSLRSSYRPVW